MIFGKTITKISTELSLARRLADYWCGAPQSSGALSVIPLFSRSAKSDKFVPPQTGMKLSQVRGYGNLELSNPSTDGIAIVPLHMGYIQDGAQNHAVCRSAFIGPNKKLMFKDACCVQAAQGGYLAEAHQWFFILPVQLRERALALRKVEDHSKLWKDIAELNSALSLGHRGHLELIISKKRSYLNQFQSRFECLPGQIGAIFLLNGKLAGLEIAPNEKYFKEIWMPLVCFAYGVGAFQIEVRHQLTGGKPQDLAIDSNDRLERKLDSVDVSPSIQEVNSLNCTTQLELEGALEGQAPNLVRRDLNGLRALLENSRSGRMLSIADGLNALQGENFAMREEERFLDLKLHTIEGSNFCGQTVEERDQLVYASVFARSAFLN